MKWGKVVGYGIATGAVLGTVVRVATKNSMFVYVGLFLGGVIGALLQSKQPQSD